MTDKVRVITVEKDLLRRNNDIGRENRALFESDNVFAINLLSSPGSGKTTILEVLIPELMKHTEVAVIEGDVETPNDALRIMKTGAKVIQINTMGGCHLIANQVETAYKELPVSKHKPTVLFIENVGNLVCPASFYLGEHLNGVVLSVTEGDDKPLKYPKAFLRSNFTIINKTDLLPYVNFDIKKAKGHIKNLNRNCRLFLMSAIKKTGLGDLLEFIKNQGC